MRARRRRSVLNTVSAAALEVAIMGLFVIIAQPQLREALFEILNVDPNHAAALSAASRSAQQSTSTSASSSTPASIDRTVKAVLDSPVGQAIEHSFAQWAQGQRPETNIPSLSTQPTGQMAAQPFTPAAPAPAMTSLTTWRDQPVQNQFAGYSPFDQYESLRVTVPNPSPSTYPSTAVAPSVQSQNYAVPSYSAQTYVSQNYTAQNYAQPNYGPTQLNANQWNIASAAQSQRPEANAHTNNWIPTQVTETSFRQVYPPPYGTQSMWK